MADARGRGQGHGPDRVRSQAHDAARGGPPRLARLDVRAPGVHHGRGGPAAPGVPRRLGRPRDRSRPHRDGGGPAGLLPGGRGSTGVQLRQVVANLLTNALRYTPAGSPLELAVV
ncbi:ATP-binding protein [Kocuria rhizophila]|nr:ATP-binding protein [Kocuria rhizophila]